MTPDELLATWHAQQTAFIEFREQRTRMMVDVLAKQAASLDRPIRVLDIGCGPGSLGTEVLRRIPDAQVIGVDRDPILLRLGKETNKLANLTFLDADLTDPTWTDLLPDTSYDGVISATALHWLSPEHLVQLYLGLATKLASNAVVMNADHLLYDAVTEPFARQLAEESRDEFLERTLATGVLSWDAWWEAALAKPGWEETAELWRQRWSTKHRIVKVSAEFHLSALRAAGACETGQLYQWLDDRIIYARFPSNWDEHNADLANTGN